LAGLQGFEVVRLLAILCVIIDAYHCGHIPDITCVSFVSMSYREVIYRNTYNVPIIPLNYAVNTIAYSGIPLVYRRYIAKHTANAILRTYNRLTLI
jgi:hypothetical protein